jgi:hypothetical protein
MNYTKSVAILEEIKNQLQIEASQSHPGERCAKGTHWNDEQNKCVALSGAMSAAHGHARNLSKMAFGAAPHEKKDLHRMAADAHKAAGRAAWHAGFNNLTFNYHAKMAGKHAKLAG